MRTSYATTSPKHTFVQWSVLSTHLISYLGFYELENLQFLSKDGLKSRLAPIYVPGYYGFRDT